MLKHYLDRLSAIPQAQFNQWSRSDQLAFLINAYNSFTIELILTAWPTLDSIKDLGGFFRSPWSKEFVMLLGKMRSLDNIEYTLIRGSSLYNDPRIHFAVNCASIGCLPLRKEAYDVSKLDQQLEEQTILFLSDRSRNRIEDGKIKLSPIFKWYRVDFQKDWQSYNQLGDFY